MSAYRIEWPCCGGITETDGYEPSACPFCEVEKYRKDAERYREVRDSETLSVAANIDVIDYGATGTAVVADMYNGADADRLIDAALAAKGETK